MRLLCAKLITVSFLFAQTPMEKTLDEAAVAEGFNEYKKAYKLYHKAALKKSDMALMKLGVFHYQGKGIAKSYNKAYEYFIEATKLGNTQAMYYLGVLHANKKTMQYDLKKAFEIFSSLESTGHAGALNRLGMFYTFGFEVVDKDYKKAVKLYEMASKQGYESAHCNLAFMYASGKGVWQNLGRAHAFAKNGVTNKNPICLKVWKSYNLKKYPEDKGWKFKFYNKPNQ